VDATTLEAGDIVGYTAKAEQGSKVQTVSTTNLTASFNLRPGTWSFTACCIAWPTTPKTSDWATAISTNISAPNPNSVKVRFP